MRFFMQSPVTGGGFIEIFGFEFGVSASVDIGEKNTPSTAGPAGYGGITVTFADDKTSTLMLEALAKGLVADDDTLRIIAVTPADEGQPGNFYEIDLNNVAVTNWTEGGSGTTATFAYEDFELQTRYFNYQGKLLDNAPFEWDVKNNDPNPTFPFPPPIGPNDGITPGGGGSGQFFMKVDGLDGGSSDADHDGWFDVVDYQMNAVNAPGSTASFQTIRVIVESDASLDILSRAAISGFGFDGLVIEGFGGGTLSSEITLGGLAVQSVTDLNGPGYIVEFSYNFIQSKAFEDGELTADRKWNIETNSADGDAPKVIEATDGIAALAAARYYMAIDGVAGDSVRQDREGWFDIEFDGLSVFSGNGGAPPKPFILVNPRGEAGLGRFMELLQSGDRFTVTIEGESPIEGQFETVYTLDLSGARITGLFDGLDQGFTLQLDFDSLEQTNRGLTGSQQLVDLAPVAWDFVTNDVPTGELPSAVPDTGGITGSSPVRYYMVIDGQNGGSESAGYENSFELTSFGNGFSHEGDSRQFNDVFVSVGSDTGYTNLLALAASGTQIGGVRILGVADVEGAETTIYEMGLGGVTLASLTDRDGAGFSMSFDFGTVALKTYDPITGLEATSGGWDRLRGEPTNDMPEATAAAGDTAGQAVRYFLAIDGVNGDSLVAGFESGWNEVNSFNLGVSHGSALGVPGGDPSFSTLNVGLQSSVALTDLLANAFQGKALAGATLRGVNENNQIVYEIALQDALIKSVSDSQGSGLSLELDYRSIQVSSTAVDPVTGELGEISKTGWDRVTNQAVSVTPTNAGAKVDDVREPQTFHMAIAGVLGDNVSEERGGWFDIVDYSVSFGNSGGLAAGGIESGSFQAGTLDVVFAFDDGLPEFLEKISFGEAFSSAVIDGTVATGDGGEAIVRSLGLTGLFVTGISEVGDIGYRVSLAFEGIGYRLFDAEGKQAELATATIAGDGDVGTSFATTPGGSRFADLLTGSALDNSIAGGQGTDTLFGLGGDDTLNGGKGRDKLLGGDGNDTINGGGSNDRLSGEKGQDTLTGGTGQDTFIFLRSSHSPDGVKRDIITDFTFDQDRIDLSRLISGTLEFVGTGAFSGVNQVAAIAAQDNPNDTIIQVNLSGGTRPELEIRVNGRDFTQFEALDFIL